MCIRDSIHAARAAVRGVSGVGCNETNTAHAPAWLVCAQPALHPTQQASDGWRAAQEIRNNTINTDYSVGNQRNMSREWKVGLFDCFSNVSSCLAVCFCQPCTVAQTTSIARGGDKNAFVAVVAVMILLFFLTSWSGEFAYLLMLSLIHI